MRTELLNKAFYRKTLVIMAPVVLQQLISVGVNFMDNIMIGGFGETAIAAVSFSNQFFSLFNFITMGLGSGAIVLSAQFWGRGDRASLCKTSAIAIQLTLILCALFSALGMAAPELILGVFTPDRSIVQAGVPYLRILGATFILSGLASTATYLLRSVGNVRIPLLGSAGAFLLNVFFNWVFIFGRLGAPRLELVGAAVGTVIARAFEMSFVFGYLVFGDKKIGFRLKQLFAPAGRLWRTYFQYGMPVLISDALLGLSLMLTGVILGHVGETVSAASAIVASLVNMIDIMNTAMSGASAVVVGNTVGQGDIPKAKREGNAYMLLSLFFGIVFIPVLYFISRPYLAAYDITAETLGLARGMILYNCILMPLQTTAYVTSKGLLRGGGDTRFLLVADSILVWLFSIPVAAVIGLVLHVNPIWVYVVVRVQFPLKGILCLVRYLSGKWIKVISTDKQKT